MIAGMKDAIASAHDAIDTVADTVAGGDGYFLNVLIPMAI